MRFFNLEIRRAPDRTGKDDPSKAVRSNRGGVPKSLVQFQDKVLAENAMRHPVLYRVLHKISSSVMGVPWYAEADPEAPSGVRANAQTIKDLNDLLQAVNDTYSPSMLRYWFTLNFAVYGRFAYKIGVSPTRNLPNAIYPLRVDRVKRRYNGAGTVIGYSYGSEGSKNVDVFPTRIRAGTTEAYGYETFTPNLSANTGDDDYSTSPLHSLGLPAGITKLLMQRAYETAIGHPNIRQIVAAEKTLTPQQVAAIEEFMENGSVGGDESGNLLFLHNTQIKVHNLDQDLSDLHTKMPLDDMTRMIAGAYDVPIALLGLGAADAAKFAGNYDSSRRAFWEDCIDPHYLSPIEEGLTLALCPPGIRVRFDRDQVPALQEARAARALTLSRVTFLTMEEKRIAAGYPKKPEEGMGTLPEVEPRIGPSNTNTNGDQ
jgi:phage portal protein BeeE